MNRVYFDAVFPLFCTLDDVDNHDIEDDTFKAIERITADGPLTVEKLENLCSAYGARMIDLEQSEAHPRSVSGVAMADFIRAVAFVAIEDAAKLNGLDTEEMYYPDWLDR